MGRRRFNNRAMLSRSSHCVGPCWMRRRRYERSNKEKRCELFEGFGFVDEAEQEHDRQPSPSRNEPRAEEEAAWGAVLAPPPSARARLRPS